MAYLKRTISAREWSLWIGVGALVATVGILLFLIMMSPAQANFFPDPGVYSLPDSEQSQVATDSTGSLAVTLSGERLNRLTFTDLDIGADGIGTAFSISASTGSIIVDAMTADGLVCPTFTIGDTTIYDAEYTLNTADGNDFSFNGGSPSDIIIGSQRGGKERTVEDDTYDKITITATADVLISELLIQDVRVFGGGCTFTDLVVGTLYVTNSFIGTGDGIDAKEFGFASGVTIGSFAGSGNTETEVHVR